MFSESTSPSFRAASGSKRLLRIALDSSIVFFWTVACLVSAYLLINSSFAYIYLLCGVYAAISTYFVATNWLRNSFLAIAASLFALLFAEIVLASFGGADAEPSQRAIRRYIKGYSEPLRQNGGPLGYGPIPDRAVRAWKIVGNDRVYDVTYTINESGFRTTPGVKNSIAGTSQLILDALDAKNIRTIRVSKYIPIALRADYVIDQRERHPARNANQLLGEALLQELSLGAGGRTAEDNARAAEKDGAGLPQAESELESGHEAEHPQQGE